MSPCDQGALLVYNAQSVVCRCIGETGLIRMFLSPLPEETTAMPTHMVMEAGLEE
jgi:ABC-type molybdate transport system permease subunit